jgi:hypothetical protein
MPKGHDCVDEAEFDFSGPDFPDDRTVAFHGRCKICDQPVERHYTFEAFYDSKAEEYF